MKIGIVGDDDTGSSDAASMLTLHGLRTALILDCEEWASRLGELEKFDAVVVGTQSRSVAPREAYRRTAEAIEFLRLLKPEKYQIKYCSTFDSTSKGNIGPSIDAAMDALGAKVTIVCPALPVNGRTVYNGHLFVGDTLLSESPMRHHPLNPMTDSNIVRWLQGQTRRRVGLLRHRDIRGGTLRFHEALATLLADGVEYIVTDAADDTDLAILAIATEDWPLLTGGSGITWGMAPQLVGRPRKRSYMSQFSRLAEGTLVVSGSMSPATERQNAFARRNGFATLAVDPIAVLDGRFDAEAAVIKILKMDWAEKDVLIHSKGGRAGMAKVHRHAADLGLTPTQAGRRIENALARVARDVLEEGAYGRVVVSGGETSGRFCREMEFTGFEVGRPIAPGVPYLFPFTHDGLMVVLKSGNFGSEDFYARVRDLSSLS